MSEKLRWNIGFCLCAWCLFVLSFSLYCSLGTDEQPIEPPKVDMSKAYEVILSPPVVEPGVEFWHGTTEQPKVMRPITWEDSFGLC